MRNRHLLTGDIVTFKVNPNECETKNVLLGYTYKIIDRRRRRSGGLERMEYALEAVDAPSIIMSAVRREWYVEYSLTKDIAIELSKMKEYGIAKWSGFEYNDGDEIFILHEYTARKYGVSGTVVSRFLDGLHVPSYRIEVDRGEFNSVVFVKESWITKVDYLSDIDSFVDDFQ